MPDKTSLNLDGVAETLLITLHIRAMKSRHPDALIKDERVVTLMAQMR